MTANRSIDRRRFLAGTALGIGAATLAACLPASSGPPTVPSATDGGADGSPDGSPGDGGSAGPSAAPHATPDVAALRRKIASLLVVGFRGLRVEPGDWIARAVAEEGIGGVILFDKDSKQGALRNIESPEQVTGLIADLRALAPERELIVAIDQEGGRVTRLSPDYGFPAVKSQQAIGPDGDAAVQSWAEGIAATLAGVGVNLNFAPVVDLDVNPDNPAIGAIARSFSADPAVVSRDAAIEIAAHRARGIRTAIKHFPGLGSATTNTDFGVADVTATWHDVELQPYRDLIAADSVDVVMAGHVVNGQIDGSAPASLSRATVTDLLREQLGWSGVVVTDDLQAAAITEAFGFDDAVALALDAGNDLLLFANQQDYDPGITTRVIDLVERLVRDGLLAESQLDAAVQRVAGLFPAISG